MTFLNYHGSFVREEGSMEDYIIMCAMYPTMTSGKVDKFLVKKGDKVIPGTAVAEIISEGYFTLLSPIIWDLKSIAVNIRLWD